ncbi:dephospho-CoA kinase [Verrucomicrobiota bacterium]
MLRIAVTGGIACGKTEVGSVMANQGAVVFECDEAAHKLMEPGQKVYHRILAQFSDDILDDHKKIDRSKLAERVFADADDLSALNRIVHPEVKAVWRKWLNNQQSVAVIIMPLLYEAGEGENWDAVVCVSSFEIKQIGRLKKRGISESGARRRISAQMPVRKKAELADFVISNNGAMKQLRAQTVRVWKIITES